MRRTGRTGREATIGAALVLCSLLVCFVALEAATRIVAQRASLWRYPNYITAYRTALGSGMPTQYDDRLGWVPRANFKGTDQQKKVGQLSGGERNRVHMAKMLKAGGNVLLLDEPTNDLDTETLAALEEALENFAGCAVVISHDRFFLDRLATHILAFEGDSHVEWFEGNFEAYEEDKIRRLGDEATRPHATTYKKLTR